MATLCTDLQSCGVYLALGGSTTVFPHRSAGTMFHASHSALLEAMYFLFFGGETLVLHWLVGKLASRHRIGETSNEISMNSLTSEHKHRKIDVCQSQKFNRRRLFRHYEYVARNFILFGAYQRQPHPLSIRFAQWGLS